MLFVRSLFPYQAQSTSSVGWLADILSEMPSPPTSAAGVSVAQRVHAFEKGGAASHPGDRGYIMNPTYILFSA